MDIKHSNETICRKMGELEFMDRNSEEAKALTHEIAWLIIEDSRRPVAPELSLVFSELMASARA